MSERTQVGDVRECCGERYLLVEQQQGSLVRRWYALSDDSEQQPVAACRRCAAALLPDSATEPCPGHVYLGPSRWEGAPASS